MSYLVCEKCGKYYELHEGKESFYYDKCECGGRLHYTGSLNQNTSPRIQIQVIAATKKKCPHCGFENPKGALFCLDCGKELGILNNSTKPHDFKPENRDVLNLSDDTLNKNTNEKVSSLMGILGVITGFGFLMITIIGAVLILIGTKIPQSAANIPQNILAGLGIIAIVITIISGMLASYIGGSKSYKAGIINGGLVGFILSVLMGVVSGASVFLMGFLVFGVLSILGGIVGTLLRRHND
ncbi:zinc-ribbon domain-containing protein [Methanobacterium aggregans]|uniref:zinc-ribbon domain-containing protein n=1 Tax=Methanobacterium aggregans TaxID=1615586 RepID=UPI001AEA1483|nr:zinc-ribbon domain-containing protein [Methanobacterium aggregans]MBP2046849.1 DNA-directed RNA polymerase subunit RPC12/RpoP/uncharacterized membrane protein [Methanobacterium aggregans]